MDRSTAALIAARLIDAARAAGAHVEDHASMVELWHSCLVAGVTLSSLIR